MDEPRIITTYPNQKVITVKKTDSDGNHIYGIFNLEACSLAAHELSDKAFRLYIFLNLNQDGYTFALSPARIEAQFGINEKRCRSAVNELIEKGYVIQRENGTNWYTFFELPIRENDVPDKEKTHNVYIKVLNDVPRHLFKTRARAIYLLHRAPLLFELCLSARREASGLYIKPLVNSIL